MIIFNRAHYHLDKIMLLFVRNNRKNGDYVGHQLSLPHLAPLHPRAGGLNPGWQSCFVLTKQPCTHISKRALRPCNFIQAFPHCYPLPPSKMSAPRAKALCCTIPGVVIHIRDYEWPTRARTDKLSVKGQIVKTFSYVGHLIWSLQQLLDSTPGVWREP